MGVLSDVQIRAWIRAGEPIAKADGDGLNFTLSKGGTAAWTLRYRFGGRAKELTLGRYPDVSLSKAREMAAEARVKVQQGNDVAREKQLSKSQRIAAWTFRELSEDYIEKKLPTLAMETQAQRKRHIKEANAKLGSMPARSVEGSDVVALIRDVGKRSYTTAEVVMTAVSEIFNHGLGLGIVSANPCWGIKSGSVLGKAPPTRQRLMLTETELREVFKVLAGLGPENALATKIALASCCRIGEVVKAEWSHLDFDGTAKWTQPDGEAIDCPGPKWMIPLENLKTAKTSGRHFVIPLLPTVAKWFEELKPFAGTSPFCFPARQCRRRQTFGREIHFDQRSLNAMLHKLADRNPGKFRPFTPHDLRSTARSHLSALGIDPLIAERCLNHAIGGLAGIYDKHDFWTQRQRALEVWTEFIVACETGKEWRSSADNVIQFRGVAA
jgi:integrase